jgi:hypothetical protein
MQVSELVGLRQNAVLNAIAIELKMSRDELARMTAIAERAGKDWDRLFLGEALAPENANALLQTELVVRER